MVSENYKNVLENVKKHCEKAGRSAEDAVLISVSKTKPVSMLLEAYEAGSRDFGENKVQELVDKYSQMPGDVRWHLIGHLQTNKVKYVVDKAYMIHSVDSVKLAKEISKEALKKNVTVRILVEVNIAEEESKFGLRAQDVIPFIREIHMLPGIEIKGLMTIAPICDDPDENRDVFRKLRQLFIDINNENIDNVTVSELSMGMTGDYEVAIEEGATYVRVGTGIFGERNYIKEC